MLSPVVSLLVGFFLGGWRGWVEGGPPPGWAQECIFVVVILFWLGEDGRIYRPMFPKVLLVPILGFSKVWEAFKNVDAWVLFPEILIELSWVLGFLKTTALYDLPCPPSPQNLGIK